MKAWFPENKKKLALLVTYRVQHAFKCIMSEQQTWCYGMGDLARSLAGYQEGIKLEISALKVCGLTIILSSCPEVHFELTLVSIFCLYCWFLLWVTVKEWNLFTDSVFWNYSQTHAVISMTESCIFSLQPCLKAQRSQAFKCCLCLVPSPECFLQIPRIVQRCAVD